MGSYGVFELINTLGIAVPTHKRWPLGDEGKQAKKHMGGVRSAPLHPRGGSELNLMLAGWLDYFCPPPPPPGGVGSKPPTGPRTTGRGRPGGRVAPPRGVFLQCEGAARRPRRGDHEGPQVCCAAAAEEPG